MGRFEWITIDLDGTLLPGDTAFAVVLRAAGKEAEVRASDQRYFSGQTTLAECFREQWQWVQKLSIQEMHRALQKADWLPEIRAGAAAMRAAGLRTRLLTDQPSTLADYTGRWALTPAICSPVQVKEGEQLAIDERFDKWANLQETLQKANVEPERVCHIGNGANDIPVFQNVGASIAVFPDDGVAADVVLEKPKDFQEIAAAALGLHNS